MAVKEILKMGDPRLQQVSSRVGENEICELAPLLEDMWDTMAEANGAGLAAPQIGVMKRVVIFGYQENPRYPDAPPVPETVLINPVITVINEQKEADWEGCLSVPGMRGRVHRYQEIHYSGFDASGAAIDRQVGGFHARVVQHECDHLDGILYPQRIHDLRDFGFMETLLENGLLNKQICDD